ncbi:MAG: hypothetical protein WCO69_02930 [Candidatus Omnitrophota bacterium]
MNVLRPSAWRYPYLLLAAVFILWSLLHIDLFNGKAFFQGDTVQYFRWLTYHVDNLVHGVYPLWNPYHAWGSVDNFDVRFLGEFNPLYWVVPLAAACGVPESAGFQAFIIMYLFLGCLGFFGLARKLIKNEGLAVVACALLLFSAFGERSFSQLVVLVTFVPTVWFFNELTGFYLAENDALRVRRLLGLFFWCMMLAVSYMPFYFLMIALVALLLTVIFCRKALCDLFHQAASVGRRYPLIMVAGVISVFWALMPGAQWYLSSRDAQYVLDVGRGDFSSVDKARVTVDDINVSGLSVVTSWPEVVDDLDITDQTFSYVSVFLLMLFLLAAATRCSAGQRVIFLTAFLMFLIGLADVFPLQRFLYDHVYLFRLCRNYYFLWPFIIAIAILFAVGQLKVFLDEQPAEGRNRWFYVAFILLAHGTFAVLLTRGEHIVVTTYLALVVSTLVFSGYALGWYGKGAFLTFGLLLAAVIQPCEVLPGFRIPGAMPKDYGIHEARFSYTRPDGGSGFNEEHGFHYRIKIMRDESGFAKAGYLGVKYSYDLMKHLPPSSIQAYIRNKFIVYQGVSYMDPEALDWGHVEGTLKGLKGPALVHDRKALRPGAVSDAARVISGLSRECRVVAFDVNRITIETDFREPVFLVYNDSYHQGWSAMIDGRAAPFFRANAAFKGIWIEPGRHLVRWQFMAGAWQFLYLGLTCLFTVWGVLMLVIRAGRRHEEHP